MAQVPMGLTDTKDVKVYPKEYREIPDILEGERISEPMELTLNKKEIKRAMSNGVVTVAGDDGEVVLNEKTYFLKDEESSEETAPEEDSSETSDDESKEGTETPESGSEEEVPKGESTEETPTE